MINHTIAKHLRIYLSPLLLLLVFTLPAGAAQASNYTTEGGNTKLDSTYVAQYISKETEYKHHLNLIKQFYRDRQYQLAWFKNGDLVPQADKLMEAIEKANKNGLSPSDYKLKNLRQLEQAYTSLSASDPQKEQRKQALDMALTASYFNYASDFYKGAVDPHSANGIEWDVKKNKVKLNKALEVVLQERENNPYYEFEALHEGYKRLQNALVKYRELEARGGWRKVNGDGIVKLNDTTSVVLEVRKRLFPDKQFNINDSSVYVYDAQVQQAVKDFQRRLGLTVDGILGPNTYQAMNISVGERIDQLLLNMERWRWLPKNLDNQGEHNRYVMVNIPAFRVTVYENDKKAMEMKAVVGEVMHTTPVFSQQIQYLMFAPYWNVPNSIVEQDIKPHLQRDLGWLARNDMEMVTTFGPNARTVPVGRVNWNTMTAQNFDYRIRQRPGPNNALGRVKFMFPNEYSVYLHDTPADHLFSEAERDFSHGCVRLERPADLATYLLQEKQGWDKPRVTKAMNARQQQRVDLEENVPVYLVYFTAWVEDDGTVHFRDDLYKHDQALAQRLF